jgi:hypothetical protein
VAEAGGTSGADDDSDLEFAHGSLYRTGYELLPRLNR